MSISRQITYISYVVNYAFHKPEINHLSKPDHLAIAILAIHLCEMKVHMHRYDKTNIISYAIHIFIFPMLSQSLLECVIKIVRHKLCKLYVG